jgi:hypothetical protein
MFLIIFIQHRGSHIFDNKTKMKFMNKTQFQSDFMLFFYQMCAEWTRRVSLWQDGPGHGTTILATSAWSFCAKPSWQIRCQKPRTTGLNGLTLCMFFVSLHSNMFDLFLRKGDRCGVRVPWQNVAKGSDSESLNTFSDAELCWTLGHDPVRNATSFESL